MIQTQHDQLNGGGRSRKPNILGVSAFYHDSAACLVQDGEVVAAAQEERFTRKKHDSGFPRQAVRYCLEQTGLRITDVDLVAFYEKPFLKFDRILHTYLSYAPLGLRSFLKAIPLWIKEKVWMKDAIRRELDYDGEMIFPEHHESHAASAFYCSPFAEAAWLTVDGVGEWTTAAYGVGKGNHLEIESELQFPHSLGLLYSAFTYFCGFKVNSGEYKLMGLGPYGEPRYVDTILNELLDLKEDGSFRLNQSYFNYCVGLAMTHRRFARLFGGPARTPESALTQREMDLARSVQVVTEEVMVRMARQVARQTGQKRLCLAGGVALNCVANGRILREGIFEDLWIQPAAGDAGGAIGAAMYGWHQYFERPRPLDEQTPKWFSPFLGPGYSDDVIRRFLDEQQVTYEALTEEALLERVTDLLAAAKVVGWFQGRMEFGPRALGSRSILGDARSPKMQEVMNLKIKFRESFRPFAPSVLREKASEYFDLDQDSPYMLLVAPVAQSQRRSLRDGEKQAVGFGKLKSVRSSIPAVTHVDASARVQTVTEADNGLYYRLIRRFYEKQGCPLIINTSFNVRGEPIVCTPADAYRCFRRTNMDYLVMGGFLLDRQEQPPGEEDGDWRQEFELD